MGRPLAKSAASSSFASDVTRDFHVGKRFRLGDTELAELRELEQAEERRENLPGLGGFFDDFCPKNSRAQREDRSDRDDGAWDVERSRNHLVHVRRGDGTQHSVDRRQELRQRECERRLRRSRLLRQIGARELIAPAERAAAATATRNAPGSAADLAS